MYRFGWLGENKKMHETKQYPEIVVGEYYWKGNLEKYMQKCKIKVKLPDVDVRGKKLNSKLVIEHCLFHKTQKYERDHASLRLSSIQECFALFVSLLLAIRVYARTTPADSKYVFKELLKRVREVWQGKYDGMIRR